MDQNQRRYQRDKPKQTIVVNDGYQYCGGHLLDISMGGVAVSYQDNGCVTGNPLIIGQALLLMMTGNVKMPAKVVRVFANGFASEFDFSMNTAEI